MRLYSGAAGQVFDPLVAVRADAGGDALEALIGVQADDDGDGGELPHERAQERYRHHNAPDAHQVEDHREARVAAAADDARVDRHLIGHPHHNKTHNHNQMICQL